MGGVACAVVSVPRCVSVDNIIIETLICASIRYMCDLILCTLDIFVT